MPATTPRGYPYSLPTDPADVPGAIQALAEAIDPDAQAVADLIRPREGFHLSGLDPVRVSTVNPFTTSRAIPFNILNFDVGNTAPELGPITRVIPQHPGFYWVEASITIPREGATVFDLIAVSLQTATETLVRSSTHVPPPASDGTNNVEVQTGAFFNGTTDYVELMCTTHVATPAVGSMLLRAGYLSMTRMTES